MTCFIETLIRVARSHDRNGERRTASLLREAAVRLRNADRERADLAARVATLERVQTMGAEEGK